MGAEPYNFFSVTEARDAFSVIIFPPRARISTFPTGGRRGLNEKYKSLHQPHDDALKHAHG